MQNDKLNELSQEIDKKIDEQNLAISRNKIGSPAFIDAATKKQAFLEVKSLIINLL